jgi:hypothetical protein
MARRAGLGLVLAVLAVAVTGEAQVVQTGAPAPDVAGAAWINSAPLTLTSLRGRVVLVEFWTYG